MIPKETFRGLVQLKGKIPRRLPRQQQPDAIRRMYAQRIVNGPLATLKRLSEKLISRIPSLLAKASRIAKDSGDITKDVGEDEIGDIIDEMQSAFAGEWSRDQFSRLINPVASDTARFNERQLNKQLQSIIGLDVVGNEPWLGEALTEFVRENVALIKSIPSQYFTEIEKICKGAVADGVRAEDLYAELEQRYNVSESRAELIARDQIGKLNGDLNRVRQVDLGITRFVWRTMRDNRVRDEHGELDGQSFEWADPPVVDGEAITPGEAIQCRCYSDPDLSELLAE